MVEEFQANSFVRLKAFPKYWGPKPQFETVIFKFVPDASSRVAEIESGSSDITLEVPYDEFDRLKKLPTLSGKATPVSDIGMIFITNEEPMLDKNLRLALHHAIDKKLLVDKLLRGYAVPIDTLEAPQYAAYDPTIKVGYSLEKAKQLMSQTPYSAKNPCKFTIQTTRGFKPKDYEVTQAIVGMWRKIGVEADIEVYEIAKHFELRAQHKLAPAAFYNWGNSIGDPSTSTGFAMFSLSPHSGWKTKDVDDLIGPLWGEKDETKRIAGYKKVDRYIAEEGYVIPLFQYEQPILYRKNLEVTTYVAGFLLPQAVKTA
jgi:peptide/nickel transport system substrate-binding protein